MTRALSIAGAGAAGAVLASRISEGPSAMVCLIEAGPRDKNALIHIPIGIAFIMRFKNTDWLTKRRRSPISMGEGSFGRAERPWAARVRSTP